MAKEKYYMPFQGNKWKAYICISVIKPPASLFKNGWQPQCCWSAVVNKRGAL